MASEFERFIGTTYNFDDGAKIKIIQIKARDDGYWVTYETSFPGSLERRLIMSEKEFIGKFAHLFV